MAASDRGLTTEAGNEKVTEELDAIKSSFADLRNDVIDLLRHALGLGKSGASAAKGSAHEAVENIKQRLADLKARGADGVSAVEHKIEENPLPAALIAFGAGFVIARLLSWRR